MISGEQRDSLLENPTVQGADSADSTDAARLKSVWQKLIECSKVENSNFHIPKYKTANLTGAKRLINSLLFSPIQKRESNFVSFREVLFKF